MADEHTPSRLTPIIAALVSAALVMTTAVFVAVQHMPTAEDRLPLLARNISATMTQMYVRAVSQERFSTLMEQLSPDTPNATSVQASPDDRRIYEFALLESGSLVWRVTQSTEIAPDGTHVIERDYSDVSAEAFFQRATVDGATLSSALAARVRSPDRTVVMVRPENADGVLADMGLLSGVGMILGTANRSGTGGTFVFVTDGASAGAFNAVSLSEPRTYPGAVFILEDTRPADHLQALASRVASHSGSLAEGLSGITAKLMADHVSPAIAVEDLLPLLRGPTRIIVTAGSGTDVLLAGQIKSEEEFLTITNALRSALSTAEIRTLVFPGGKSRTDVSAGNGTDAERHSTTNGWEVTILTQNGKQHQWAYARQGRKYVLASNPSLLSGYVSGSGLQKVAAGLRAGTLAGIADIDWTASALQSSLPFLIEDDVLTALLPRHGQLGWSAGRRGNDIFVDWMLLK